MVDMQSVLRPLSDFERSLGELYTSFSERFSTDPEAARLFLRLTAEERNHVTLVEYQRRLVRANPQDFSKVDVDPDDIRAATLSAADFKARAQHFSLAEAVGIALDFEESAIEMHAKRAVAQANPDFAQLVEGLARGDEQHARTLRDFAVARGWRVPAGESPDRAPAT